MTIEISSLAEQDLADGFRFYETQAPGIGQYFLDTMYSEIGSLAYFGGIHRKVGGFHRMVTRKFPYMIYYEKTQSIVRVVAIIGTRRGPDYISSRMSV